MIFFLKKKKKEQDRGLTVLPRQASNLPPSSLNYRRALLPGYSLSCLRRCLCVYQHWPNCTPKLHTFYRCDLCLNDIDFKILLKQNYQTNTSGSQDGIIGLDFPTHLETTKPKTVWKTVEFKTVGIRQWGTLIPEIPEINELCAFCILPARQTGWATVQGGALWSPWVEKIKLKVCKSQSGWNTGILVDRIPENSKLHRRRTPENSRGSP